MYGKSNVDRVERIKAVIDRMDDRGIELMQRAFREPTKHAIDRCLKSIKILSDRAMRLQAIVDSMPRRRSMVEVVPSVN